MTSWKGVQCENVNIGDTTPHPHTRVRRRAATVGGVIAWSLVAVLGLAVAAGLLFFAVRAADLLNYPYPLDYGEGPLLAQVNLLLGGTPVWRLYADPSAPPYAVVNYPPIYHLLSALVALPLGNALLAGRLVSLASALAATAALWALVGAPGQRTLRAGLGVQPVMRALIALSFLALPIVREWSALMRADVLGVCLGLWGLLLVQRNAGRSRVLWAALPLGLSLYVKPSLIAAPAAVLLWLFFRDRRRALLLAGLLAVGGGLAFALLQLASGGWFALHVLAANANEWQPRLAYAFWHDQLLVLWPLLAAGVVGLLSRRLEEAPAARSLALLPLYYTLFGAIAAFGVGKVGAYANYFLEFYAGLIWLAAAGNYELRIMNYEVPPAGWVRSSIYGLLPPAHTGVGLPIVSHHQATKPPRHKGLMILVAWWLRVLVVKLWGYFGQVVLVVVLLVVGGLLRYYPVWSATYLQRAGIIEKQNPPRLAFGRYGVWQDLRRERDILTALAGVNAALVAEVRAAGGPIVTDVPGVAAQAGQLARLQAFEHRQLFDAGLADQRPLLRDLANGRVPLVVLDYLGNWLTPEMIALITHRYAQDGSRGTYDLYRPVDPGPAVAADLDFPGGLRLAAYHLAPSPGRPAYHAGEIALLTLDWQRAALSGAPTPPANYEVALQLTDGAGAITLEVARPLLYGALVPADWPEGAAMQHMQPIALPASLPAGTYGLALTLRSGERDLAPPRVIARLVVEPQSGRLLGDTESGAPRRYFVPAPLLDAWERAGGDDGPGGPLMPAVPFPGYTLQCFVRACLRLERGQVQRLPLGSLIHLGDAGLSAAPPVEGTQEHFSATGLSLGGPFLDYWRAHGGAEALGPPITGELIRGGLIVQYTLYARLERPIDGADVQRGRLGDDFLRLPAGLPYRWP